jgi:hypothetical protein
MRRTLKEDAIIAALFLASAVTMYLVVGWFADGKL